MESFLGDGDEWFWSQDRVTIAIQAMLGLQWITYSLPQESGSTRKMHRKPLFHQRAELCSVTAAKKLRGSINVNVMSDLAQRQRFIPFHYEMIQAP